MRLASQSSPPAVVLKRCTYLSSQETSAASTRNQQRSRLYGPDGKPQRADRARSVRTEATRGARHARVSQHLHVRVVPLEAARGEQQQRDAGGRVEHQLGTLASLPRRRAASRCTSTRPTTRCHYESPCTSSQQRPTIIPDWASARENGHHKAPRTWNCLLVPLASSTAAEYTGCGLMCHGPVNA